MRDVTTEPQSALAFLADLRRQGVRVWAEADKLNYSAVPGALTPELRAELVRRKPELLRALRPASLQAQPIMPVPRDQALPLSYQQERLWFLDQLDPGNPAFNMTSPVRLTGALDSAALERSLSTLAARHESLRTTFGVQEGQPVQIIQPAAPVELDAEDLRELPEAERAARAQAAVDAYARLRFDLARGPLWAARLLRLGEREHLLLLTVHHAISDAWSQNVLFAELAALYEAYAAGREAELPALPIQYADYAAWQRRTFTAESLNEGLAYWRQHLRDAPPASGLTPDRPRPAVQTFNGRALTAELPGGLINALQAVSKAENATLFMTLLTALHVLLHASTGQTDLVVGAPAAARAQPQVEKVYGMFVNNLALRADLTGDPTFRELLRRVRAAALPAYSHQHVPFEKLLEDLRPERQPGRTPIFQVYFNMLTQERPLPRLPGLVSTRAAGSSTPALFDLSFTLRRQGEQWSVTMAYNTDLFEARRMEAWFEQYQALLQQVVDDPDRRLSDLALLTPAQRAWLLDEVNATDRPLPSAAAVTDLIAAQARQRPAHSAVAGAGHAPVTYGALDAQANQLAHYLIELGVGRETLAAVCLERTPAMVAALLAIHKAGGAYLPLDPDYPPERLAFMLADSGARLLLTSSDLRARLPQTAARVVDIDQALAEAAAKPAAPPDVTARGEDLAYMIYTSGSTGQPKGVLVEQRSLLNHTAMAGRVYGLRPEDRVLQFAALSWDTSIEEIFPALAHGATLVLRTKAMLETVPAFAAFCAEQGVTVINLPTAFWHTLAMDDHAPALRQLAEQVRLVIIGGERARPERVAAWRRLAGEGPRLVNTYGATEATAVSTLAELGECDPAAAEVPIGRPVDNVRVYVLDANRQPALPGAPGELYIGGLGVARGYHSQPELTQARFVPDPFRPGAGARLYRTGDVARVRADGQLEFRGRADRQVKVRGYRIEPGEIEAVLRQHPAVRDAAVVVRGGDDGILAAYLVDDGRLPPDEARAWLQARLPAYMLPAAWVRLPRLPLSPNGKLDLAALPEVSLGAAGGRVAARDDLERQMARLWEEVLGAPAVGAFDDFFALGGHSLLAIRLFSRIEAVFGRRLPLGLLFEAPTVAHLAEALRQPAADRALAAWPVLVPIQPRGAGRPFFCVHDVGGTSVRFAELGRLMGSGRPFYALEAQGFDGQREPHDSIEAMAAHYVEAVRQVQPRGPYALGGYCFGGAVAYEMARQLRAAGEAVSLVAVIEGYAPTRHLPSAPWWTPRRLWLYLANLPGWIEDHWALGPRYFWGRTRQVGTQLAKQALRRLGLRPALKAQDMVPRMTDLPESHQRVLEALLRLSGRYRPGGYDGCVTLFSVRRQSMFRNPDPQRGWQHLARGGVAIRRIAGSHHTILDPQHVGSLARALREELEKVQAEADGRA